MEKTSIQKYWHELFEFSILIKGINGVWETVSGFLVLFLSNATLNNWFLSAVHNELLEDPNDRFVNFAMHVLQNFSNDTKTFIAVYILFHGLLNIFLVIQLYRNRHWAYPAAIGVMSVFIFYQLHRIYIHHSPFLAAITIFDIFYTMLVWHEYKYQMKTAQTQAKA